MDWTTLLNDYGFPTVLFLLLASHAKGILAFAERMLSKAWPTFAEQRRLKLEREAAADERLAERQRLRLEQVAAADERVDTILALKDMLLAYRQELDDSKLERRQLQNRLYELIGLYQKRDAQIVEALRDISEVLRSQTRRLDEITVTMRIQNSYDKNEETSRNKS